MEQIKICINTWGKYNNGQVMGKWLTLPMDYDDIQKEVDLMTSEHDDELFIIDSIAPFKIEEGDDIEDVSNMAEVLQDLEGDDLIKFEWLCEFGGYPTRDIIESARWEEVEMLEGVYDNRKLGEALLEDPCYLEVPDHLVDYIDEEYVGSEAQHDGWDFHDGNAFKHNNN